MEDLVLYGTNKNNTLRVVCVKHGFNTEFIPIVLAQGSVIKITANGTTIEYSSKESDIVIQIETK